MPSSASTRSPSSSWIRTTTSPSSTDAHQQYAPEAFQELVRLALKAKSEGARIIAIKEILDRAYGKATQPMEHSSGMLFTHEQALAEIERRANAELGLNEEPKFKLDTDDDEPKLN